MAERSSEMAALAVLLYSMSLFGVTWMLRYTNGPGHIFQKIRKIAGIQYFELITGDADSGGVVEEIPDKFFAELFGCFWCLSTWLSLMLIVLLFPNIEPKGFLLLWWGSIGISGFLHELVL